MRSVSEDLLKNTIEYLDINSAAQILSVSPATIRNWVKANKIKPNTKVGRSLLFDKQEIEALHRKISSGEFSRLQSRRNKKYLKGNFIPSNYVESTQYLDLAAQICSITDRIDDTYKIRLVLHEIALILLIKRGYIATPVEFQKGSSLTALRIKDLLYTGTYLPLLNQLLPIETLDVREEDLHTISKFNELEIPFFEGQDFLGLVYLSLRNMSDRKISGSYYTPTNIVKELVTETFEYSNYNPSLIDPCCGSGNFLITSFLNLKKEMLRQNNDIDLVERTILEEHLTGVDIDPIAVTLAKLNIALHLSRVLKDVKEIKIYNEDSLKTYKRYEDRFDIVIGNPPWGFDFSQIEIEHYRKTYTLAKNTVESSSLFIENSLRLLKQNGIISYVLPESILNVGTHAAVRKLLLDNTSVRSINLLGDKFSKVYAPSVTLIANKEKDTNHENSLMVREDGTLLNVIKQKRLLTNPHYVFNVRTSDHYQLLLEKIRTLPEVRFLKNNADFALGIVTGDNAQYIMNKQPENGEHIIKGSNVFKYNYYTDNSFICFEPQNFQQVAPEKFYRSEEKLVYRFINSNLTFAYDKDGVLTLNSANILIPRLEGLQIKYVLAVLNSRVAQFFHKGSFQSVKVLRQHIESIPIPWCEGEKQKKVVEMVNALIRSNDPTLRENLYNQIDEKIMDIFQLSKQEKGLIHENFNKVKFLTRN